MLITSRHLCEDRVKFALCDCIFCCGLLLCAMNDICFWKRFKTLIPSDQLLNCVQFRRQFFEALHKLIQLELTNNKTSDGKASK